KAYNFDNLPLTDEFLQDNMNPTTTSHWNVLKNTLLKEVADKKGISPITEEPVQTAPQTVAKPMKVATEGSAALEAKLQAAEQKRLSQKKIPTDREALLKKTAAIDEE